MGSRPEISTNTLHMERHWPDELSMTSLKTSATSAGSDLHIRTSPSQLGTVSTKKMNPSSNRASSNGPSTSEAFIIHDRRKNTEREEQPFCQQRRRLDERFGQSKSGFPDSGTCCQDPDRVSKHASNAFSDQRICRRGTEKPCYKISSFQDSSLRVNFEAARLKCQEDDGELLSIETENEQRLVERFVLELRASDGDFWIGLQRSLQYSADCSAQYHWLDYSKATFRNWMLMEPSCGLDRCTALFYRPSSSAGQKKSNLFKWTDFNCNSKNNFICKYSDEKYPVPTPTRNITTHTGSNELTSKHTSVDNGGTQTELESSANMALVSVSDDVYYFLLAILPVMLLIILAVSGVFCFRVMSKRRKEENEIYAVPGQWVHPAALQAQNEYKHGNKFNQSATHLEYMSSEINRSFSVTSHSEFGGYENVPGTTRDCVFVTNDIYETSRNAAGLETGWVDNDIYGY
ncbi:hypothetical protein DNTS_017996 [Danionella cerebrum]|uniref:C-type lectin domain-containing protein n=1 Tax=Danionella cerebrum TaxID=2873325 RepID=A0A553Q4M6_9TELE|nr:hypothetical protein DNTS_017996 [Danionella translucida]